MWIIAFAALRFFYTFGRSSILNPLQPVITQDFGLSPAMIGWVSSLFFYGEALLVVSAGLMLDRLSPRWLTTLALLLAVFGVVLMAEAEGVITLMLSRLMMAVGAGFQFAGCVRVVVNWLGADKMAKGMGLVVSLGILGGTLAQTPITYFIQHLGWRDTLLGVAALGLIITLIAFFVVKDHPPHFKWNEAAQKINAANVFARFKLAFFKKQNLLCAIYVSLMNLSLFMLGAVWGIAYLGAVNQVPELEASSICSMIFLGSMIASPLLGMWSDRLKNRTVLMKYGALVSFLFMLGLLSFKTSDFIPLLFCYFILGFITSVQVIAFPLVIESNSPGISSSATSVISIISILGGAISQPLFGFLAGHNGYSFAILLLPLAFFISFVLSFFIQETHCNASVS